jgi:hypothetical protein
MVQQVNKYSSGDTMEDYDEYDKLASAYCKGIVFEWCLVGWIYAAVTWHVFWLPGILVFFPGILFAGFIAAFFFIPSWFIKKKIKRDWHTYGNKNWGLLVFATILKIGGFIGPIVGSIAYVHLLRHFIERKG